MPRMRLIGVSILVAVMGVGCGSESPSAPQASDAISIGWTLPVSRTLLDKGQSVSVTATVSYRLETASSAQVGMVVEDQATNVIVGTPVKDVVVPKGTGTASFAADFTVPDGAQKLVVYFALFADGQTKTRTVDTVEYFVRR
jgi:hypothetical protein